MDRRSFLTATTALALSPLSALCFGGQKRNRLFMTASTSVYALCRDSGCHVAIAASATSAPSRNRSQFSPPRSLIRARRAAVAGRCIPCRPLDEGHAIHPQHGTGHIRRIVRCQKHRRAPDVLGGGQATERQLGPLAIQGLVRVPLPLPWRVGPHRSVWRTLVMAPATRMSTGPKRAVHAATTRSTHHDDLLRIMGTVKEISSKKHTQRHS